MSDITFTLDGRLVPANHPCGSETLSKSSTMQCQRRLKGVHHNVINANDFDYDNVINANDFDYAFVEIEFK
ncbi:MAG: hypothetical protein AAGF55_00915 [Pseudomonadota bacterium]